MTEPLPTKERLAAELRKVAAKANPKNAAKYEQFAVRAETGEFDDYSSVHICGPTQLYQEMLSAGFVKFAARIASGEFDATKAESNAWAASEDGQAAFAQLPDEGRSDEEQLMTDTPEHPGEQALREIVAGLDGVTPGPWFQTCPPWGDREGIIAGSQDGNIGVYVAFTDPYYGRGENERQFPEGCAEADAAHIARCDPDTIRAIDAYTAALEAERDTLRAENARLRRALEQIAKQMLSHEAQAEYGDDIACGCNFTEAYDEIIDAARAALQGSDHDQH